MAFIYDIGILILIAVLFGFLVGAFKQPLILGYVIAGILVGPHLLGLVSPNEVITLLSDFGIAFLLFVVGIGIDFRKIKELGSSALIIGIIQVVLTFIAGYFMSVYFGLGPVEASILSVMLALSSTEIVVKLFSDTLQMDTIHGRLVLAILLIQDVVAIVGISLMSGGPSLSSAALLVVLKNGIIIALTAFVFAKLVLPLMVKFMNKNSELMLMGSIATAFFFGGLSIYLNYSLSIGAFVAGIILGSVPQAYEITTRVKPLRDFFVVVFFATLGMSINFSNSTNILFLAAAIMMVIIIKPLIVYVSCKFFKYSNRTSFFSSIALGQTSLFALVMAAEGMKIGLVSQESFNIISLVTLITMTLTTYTIRSNTGIYERISRLLPRDKEVRDKIGKTEKMKDHILVIGTHKLGMTVIDSLALEKKKNFLVIDHNPERVRELMDRKISAVCTDMDNAEMYTDLGFEDAKAVISTVSNLHNNLSLISQVRKFSNKPIIVVTARNDSDALRLYDQGADYVIYPEILAGTQLVKLLGVGANLKELGEKYHKELRKKEN